MESNTGADLSRMQIEGNIRGMKGWLKFLGILMIVSGIAQALSIVGILWGWLPFWLGLILNQAGSRAQEYVDRKDDQSLAQFTAKLKTYFVVTGILTIASICLSFIMVIGLIVMAVVAGGIPALLKDYIPNW